VGLGLKCGKRDWVGAATRPTNGSEGQSQAPGRLVASGLGDNHDAATRAATAATVVQGRIVGGSAIRGNRARSGYKTRADHNDSATGATRAGVSRTVIPAARAATATHHQTINRSREGSATDASDGLVDAPSIAARSTRATVGAASSA
jgi:hypothetical protein